ASWTRGQGVHRARGRARAIGCARRGDQGVRSRSALRLCLSAAHRVRRRAAEDAHRQDQADRVTRESVGTAPGCLIVSRNPRRPVVVEGAANQDAIPAFEARPKACVSLHTATCLLLARNASQTAPVLVLPLL